MADIMGEDQVSAMTRVFEKLRKDREVMESARSPDQVKADEDARSQANEKQKRIVQGTNPI